ncbi:phage tail protein [Longibacter salinarum]|uniref:Phage tail protein n=2 Tax=Longibacter salinarum TaxID=1850348 RepID=A0A2A8CV65_9BACT|nr:phage tail protein [Longibacter salinarum]
MAAAAAGGGIITGLFGSDSAQARPTERSAGVSGAPLAYEPLIGGIGMFGGNFAPRNWANCDGQLLAISQNTALFSILGTIYGGDGRTTFAVPDLRGRVPIHAGQGPGLTSRNQGQSGGTETETLAAAQIPNHSHPASLPVTSAEGDATSPDGNALGAQPNSRGTQPIYSTNATNGTMDVNSAAVGGSQSHNNMPPFAVIRYVIALTGIFPSRN